MKATAGLALATLVALVIAATALADERKASDKKLGDAASAEFDAAIAAEDKKDFERAITHYERAWKLVAHPSTAFNLAELYAKTSRTSQAVRMYAIYAALSPTAKDLKRVSELVETLFAKPATIRIESKEGSDLIDLARSFVFVDGRQYATPGGNTVVYDKVSKKNGVVGKTMNPYPTVDVVTEFSAASKQLNAEYGTHRRIEMTAPARIQGSVVISAFKDFILFHEGKRFTDLRIDLPPGRHTMAVFDGIYECAALDISVPKTGILYVHIGLTTEAPVFPAQRPPRCRAHMKKQEWLHF